MIRSFATTYDNQPIRSTTLVHAGTIGWNPFGSLQPLRDFVACKQDRRKVTRLTDDLDIRCRVLYGMFRQANPENMATEINSLEDFVGLVLYLSEQQRMDAFIYVQPLEAGEDPGEPFYHQETALNAGKGKLPAVGTRPNVFIPRNIFEYTLATVNMGEFTDLAPVHLEETRFFILAGQAAHLRGSKGTDYMQRLVVADGSFEAAILSVKGTNLSNYAESVGQLPSGVRL